MLVPLNALITGSFLLQGAPCECAERPVQVPGATGDHAVSYQLHARLHGDQAGPGVHPVDEEAERFRPAMRTWNVIWQHCFGSLALVVCVKRNITITQSL